MTIEQIRSEIKQMIAQLTKTKDTNGVVALYWALATLDKLGIPWHPYPEEEPSKEGNYLVTLSDGNIAIDSYVTDWFDGDPKATVFYRWGENDEEDIIAWTELPKPYKKEKS